MPVVKLVASQGISKVNVGVYIHVCGVHYQEMWPLTGFRPSLSSSEVGLVCMALAIAGHQSWITWNTGILWFNQQL